MAVRPDSIPRYAEPTWDELEGNEPKEHKCANCTHKVRILLDGKGYFLCVQERDDHAEGEVYECDPEMRDCDDWRWDADQLD